jgi:hypothetical protein
MKRSIFVTLVAAVGTFSTAWAIAQSSAGIALGKRGTQRDVPQVGVRFDF